MPTRTELERLAAATNQLRPEWPVKSILTFLSRDHAHRAYADLAVALTAIAVDPASRTPTRLNEAGPWWQLTSQTVTNQVGPGSEPRCEKPGHEHELGRACRACRSEAIAASSDEPADPGTT